MTPDEIREVLDYLDQLSDESYGPVINGLVKLAHAIASRAEDIESSTTIPRGDACIRAASLREILSEAFRDIKQR